MTAQAPLEILRQHFTQTGITYEEDPRNNRIVCLFPYPEEPVCIVIAESPHFIEFHVTMPKDVGPVPAAHQPAVAELLHRLNHTLTRFVWLLDFDTGDICCHFHVPTAPHPPRDEDFQDILRRLTVLLTAMVPPILDVAAGNSSPTEAARQAQREIEYATVQMGFNFGERVGHDPLSN
jgi:hypothetical protein